MAAPNPLPFDAFLEVLRAKGYAIGFHEYVALASLLEHWDRLHPSELGDAFAALIGRSQEEVDGIRRLFDLVYAPTPPPSPPPPPPPDRLSFVRRHVWALSGVAAVVILIAAGLAIFPRPSEPLPRPDSFVPPLSVPNQNGAAEPPIPLPPPAPPDLPDPPRFVERAPLATALGGGFLAALAVFWSLKARQTARRWQNDAWSAARASLPGPYHFDEIVRKSIVRLPQHDVEDAATMLGRVFSKQGLARELDVPRTLRATLRRGLMPTFVTKPRRTAETILVLQDVCQEMRLWDPMVEAFLVDLRRQGIRLERTYFDGDLSRLSDRPHRPAAWMENVFRARPDAPVLVISSGTGLRAMLDATDQTWRRLLGARARKTWLTPVADVSLWPAAFDELPLDVWAMTVVGLMNAARQLVGAEVDPSARVRMAAEGRVTREDIERLKRLASLVPHPSPVLLDVLRQRFAPDVSTAGIYHLMIEGGGPATPVIHLSEDELRRNLNAVRRENPDLEAAARHTIIDVLVDSEPVAGSAAHERWRIAIGVQRLLLADLDGDSAAVARATETLRELAKGPMWEEVEGLLRISPEAPSVREHVRAIAVPHGQGPTLSSRAARLAGAPPVPWSWPGLRELVPAMIVAGLLLASAVGLGALPRRVAPHQQDAYNLDYAPGASLATPQLTIARRWRDDSLPRVVDLYQIERGRQDRVFRSNLAIADDTPTSVQLAAADTGTYYQVRARLAEGNLAVSKAVWVPSDRLVFVLIDASPWANVTISDGQTPASSAQATPFTAALLPGTYQLHFESPALTPASRLDQTITVPVAGGKVHVTMPGFDATRAVDSLMPPAAQ